MKQDISISRTKAGCGAGKWDVILQAVRETRTAHRPHSTQRIALNNSHESSETPRTVIAYSRTETPLV